MIDFRRKNAIAVVRREPTDYDRAYEGVLAALDRAAPLSAKQRRQLYGEVMAELEQREADLDDQERAAEPLREPLTDLTGCDV